MTENLFCVTLKCNLTGGEFKVWTEREEEAPAMAERLEATVVRVDPSSRDAFDMAQLLTALGVRPQMRWDE